MKTSLTTVTVGAIVALASLHVSRTYVAGAQSLSADSAGPPFEVASVKPNRSGEPRLLSIGLQPGGRFTARNASLRELVAAAYGDGGRGLQAYRIVGGPDWVNTDRFDVEARADGEARKRMFFTLRTLLRERFKLAVHVETRQLPTYVVVLAREDGRVGPQLRSAAIDCAALRKSGQPPPAPEDGKAPPCALSMAPGLLRGGGLSSAEIVLALSPLLDRFVVDRTGLAGAFDFELRWTSTDQPTPVGSLPERPPAIEGQDAGSSLFTALREQLGLRLDSQRGPVDVIVIDSADRPTPD
jgi:uncharacterized protein (TIGR03435 family)